MAETKTKSKLAKAFIEVLDAQGKSKEPADIIPVLFYPGEYSMEKSNEFANINIPGLESPLLQFVRGGLRTLTMDLFFDTYIYGKSTDVREHTKRIVNLLKIDPKLHAPPLVRFVWAGVTSGEVDFICVLSRVSQKFTMFRSDGVPVRATLSVTFNEYHSEISEKEGPLESWDRSKRYILKQGDSLWFIAAQEYGEPTTWRAIAEANNINNPRILETGQEIIIPPVE